MEPVIITTLIVLFITNVASFGAGVYLHYRYGANVKRAADALKDPPKS